MKNSSKIEVTPYQPEWPEQFKIEANKIKTALADNCLAIHHVGSTSVPGLAAKPRIDIIVEVKSFDKVKESLAPLGIEYMGEWNIPMHYGLRRREGVQLNLHVYLEGHPEIELNLKFRDYLRTHPEAVEAYAKLKYQLIEEERSHTKDGSMFRGYTLGKSDFIKDILIKTGFNRTRFVLAAHHAEWEAVKHFRNKYFFIPHGIEDPYTWTFDHKDHKHLVLYMGTDIVGYAHVQLWPEQRAAMRIIVIDEDKRGQSLGGQFMDKIEEWLKLHEYNSLHVESTPKALRFYQHQGYIPMPFGDPDGYEGGPDDIELGKKLR